MQGIEKMQATLQEHAEAIVDLRRRDDQHDEDIARHERHISKLDDAIVMLRETIGRVATRDDISDLRKDVSDRFDARARDAHNSVPVWLAAGVAGIGALIGVLEFALGHWHG